MGTRATHEFQVRDATVADLPALIELIRDVGADTYANAGDAAELEEWMTDRASHRTWADRVSRPDFVVLVREGEPDSELVATGYVQDRSEAAYYGGFYSRPRKQGHARATFASLEERATTWGRSIDECEIWERLVISRGMFERRGFRYIDAHLDRNFRGARILRYRRVQ